MNFENLEQAIEILTNPIANTDEGVKKEANDYLLNFVSQNYANWREFFRYFKEARLESTKYWILQALSDIAKDYWEGLSPEEQVNFANGALEFAMENTQPIVSVAHYLKKYAHFCALLVKQGYPHRWNSVFEQLIKGAKDSLDVLKLTFAILEQINDEVIEREACTTNEDIAVANRVKDGLREGDVVNIVELSKTVLDNYTQVDTEIVTGAIDTMADLIDWNDLSLFESSLEVITQLLDVKEYQQNALY